MKEWIVLEKHIGKSCSERIGEGFNGWNNGWISHSRMSRISVYKVGVPGKELTRGIFATSWTTEGSAAAAAKSLQLCLTLCDPHRRQPTRLPHPWDSPSKNTGVGCHFLLQCTKVKSESEVAQSCLTLSNPMDCSLPGSSIHGIFQARILEWVVIAFSD